MGKQPQRGPHTTTSNARTVTAEVLQRVLRGAFLAPTLSRALNVARLNGPERSLATDLTYGTVRYLAQLDHILAPLLKAPEKLPHAVLNALRVGAYELIHRGTPAYAVVNSWVDVVRDSASRLTGLTNAVLRRVEPLPEGAPAALRFSLPDWLLREFAAALGEEGALNAASAMLAGGPLWLTAFSEEAQPALKEDGAQVEPLWLLGQDSYPASLAVRSPVALDELTAYREGLVQPQNPAALLTALTLAPGPGDQIYDLAAGGGVKSAALAASGAAVTAFELRPGRQEAARRNLERLKLAVELRLADLIEPQEAPPVPKVLLDAPCAGTGTLRGHPEIKLRLQPEDLLELSELQGRMLEVAALLVAPQGQLLYAVCSLTRLEGVGVIEDFLAANPDFAAEELVLPLPSVEPAGGGPGRYVLPNAGVDGFYLASLRKR